MFSEKFTIEQKKLFSNYPKFDYFRNVDEEKVNKNVEMFTSAHKTSLNQFNPKLKTYQKALLAATNNIRLTFDEKILFLIKICDPKYRTYYISLDYNILSKAEIKDLPEEEQEDALYDNDLVKLERKDAIRSELGFYQPELIFYEKILILLKNKKDKIVSLSTGIKKDHTRALRSKMINDNIDLSIADKELEYIMKEAQEYIKKYGIPSINDLAYQITIEGDNFNLRSLKEKLLFIMYVIDSNFEYYKSYESHGTWSDISKDVSSILGEYNQLIMDIEIRYNKQIKKLSKWD